MITLNLQPIFKARGIEKPYSFLMRAGFSAYTASSLVNKKVKNIGLNHLELLCKALICEPNDLFKWTPDKDYIYAENFPLAKLRESETSNNWKETLATMPLNELKDVTKNITKKTDGY